MKRILLFCALLCAANVTANTWEENWVEGLQYNKDDKFLEALECFDKSVNIIKNDGRHDFVFISRAKAYMNLGKWEEAADDLTRAINSPHLLLADHIEALKLRIICYSNLDQFENVKADYTQFSEVNPYMPKFEYTSKYQIIRHLENMPEDEKQFMLEMWVSLGFCKDASKITQYGGIFVIELTDGAAVPSQAEKEDQEYGVIQQYDISEIELNGGRQLTEDEKKNLIQKQIEGCNYYCDKVFNTALIIANRGIKVWSGFGAAVITIEVLRDSCKNCCQGNGGFYETCIQPMVTYYQDLKDQIDKFLDGKRLICYPRRW